MHLLSTLVFANLTVPLRCVRSGHPRFWCVQFTTVSFTDQCSIAGPGEYQSLIWHWRTCAENGHAKLQEVSKNLVCFFFKGICKCMLVKCWNEGIEKQRTILKKKVCTCMPSGGVIIESASNFWLRLDRGPDKSGALIFSTCQTVLHGGLSHNELSGVFPTLNVSKCIKFILFTWSAALNLRWICSSSILCGFWDTVFSYHSRFSQYCGSRLPSLLWTQHEIVCSLSVPDFVIYFECDFLFFCYFTSSVVIFYNFQHFSVPHHSPGFIFLFQMQWTSFELVEWFS